MIRPYYVNVEYYVQFLSPYYRKDVIKLEKMQKGFIRMLLELEGLRLDRGFWGFWSEGG